MASRQPPKKSHGRKDMDRKLITRRTSDIDFNTLMKMREIRFLVELSHDCIVAVLDLDVKSDTPLIVKEQNKGSLRDLIYSDGYTRIRRGMRIDIMRQILDASTYIHNLNICHGRISSSNIFVYSLEGEISVKLSEFQDARILSGQSRFSSSYNLIDLPSQSLDHLAPEVILQCGPFGCAQDVWSIGSVIAELISRHMIFEGPTPEDLISSYYKAVDVNYDPSVLHILDRSEGASHLHTLSQLYMESENNYDISSPTSFSSSTLSSTTQSHRQHQDEDWLYRKLPDAKHTHPLLLPLLRSMLTMDPMIRITSTNAMHHSIFRDQMIPSLPIPSSSNQSTSTSKSSSLTSSNNTNNHYFNNNNNNNNSNTSSTKKSNLINLARLQEAINRIDHCPLNEQNIQQLVDIEYYEIQKILEENKHLHQSVSSESHSSPESTTPFSFSPQTESSFLSHHVSRAQSLGDIFVEFDDEVDSDHGGGERDVEVDGDDGYSHDDDGDGHRGLLRNDRSFDFHDGGSPHHHRDHQSGLYMSRRMSSQSSGSFSSTTSGGASGNGNGSSSKKGSSAAVMPRIPSNNTLPAIRRVSSQDDPALRKSTSIENVERCGATSSPKLNINIKDHSKSTPMTIAISPKISTATTNQMLQSHGSMDQSSSSSLTSSYFNKEFEVGSPKYGSYTGGSGSFIQAARLELLATEQQQQQHDHGLVEQESFINVPRRSSGDNIAATVGSWSNNKPLVPVLSMLDISSSVSSSLGNSPVLDRVCPPPPNTERALSLLFEDVLDMMGAGESPSGSASQEGNLQLLLRSPQRELAPLVSPAMNTKAKAPFRSPPLGVNMNGHNSGNNSGSINTNTTNIISNMWKGEGAVVSSMRSPTSPSDMSLESGTTTTNPTPRPRPLSTGTSTGLLGSLMSPRFQEDKLPLTSPRKFPAYPICVTPHSTPRDTAAGEVSQEYWMQSRGNYVEIPLNTARDYVNKHDGESAACIFKEKGVVAEGNQRVPPNTARDVCHAPPNTAREHRSMSLGTGRSSGDSLDNDEEVYVEDDDNTDSGLLMAPPNTSRGDKVNNNNPLDMEGRGGRGGYNYENQYPGAPPNTVREIDSSDLHAPPSTARDGSGDISEEAASWGYQSGLTSSYSHRDSRSQSTCSSSLLSLSQVSSLSFGSVGYAGAVNALGEDSFSFKSDITTGTNVHRERSHSVSFSEATLTSRESVLSVRSLEELNGPDYNHNSSSGGGSNGGNMGDSVSNGHPRRGSMQERPASLNAKTLKGFSSCGQIPNPILTSGKATRSGSIGSLPDNYNPLMMPLNMSVKRPSHHALPPLSIEPPSPSRQALGALSSPHHDLPQPSPKAQLSTGKKSKVKATVVSSSGATGGGSVSSSGSISERPSSSSSSSGANSNKVAVNSLLSPRIQPSEAAYEGYMLHRMKYSQDDYDQFVWTARSGSADHEDFST